MLMVSDGVAEGIEVVRYFLMYQPSLDTSTVRFRSPQVLFSVGRRSEPTLNIVEETGQNQESFTSVCLCDFVAKIRWCSSVLIAV